MAGAFLPQTSPACPWRAFCRSASLWEASSLAAFALRVNPIPAPAAATLVTIPWAEHGFDFRPGGAAEQLERTLVVRFLRYGKL